MLGLCQILAAIEGFISHFKSKPIGNKLPEPGMPSPSEWIDEYQELFITCRNYSPIIQ
jgi:hypothetical protein